MLTTGQATTGRKAGNQSQRLRARTLVCNERITKHSPIDCLCLNYVRHHGTLDKERDRHAVLKSDISPDDGFVAHQPREAVTVIGIYDMLRCAHITTKKRNGVAAAGILTLIPTCSITIHQITGSMYPIQEHVSCTVLSRTSTEDTMSIGSLSSPILPTGLNSDSAPSSVRSRALVHLVPAPMLSFASTSAEWNRGASRKFTEWSRLALALDIRLLLGYSFRLHNAQRIPEESREKPRSGTVRVRERRFVQR
jgi:hypothetical protein